MKLPKAQIRTRRPATRHPPAPYVGEQLVELDTDVGPLWMPASDGVMRPYLEASGTWEPEEAQLLSSFIRPGMSFLDVGANVGYFSRFVARHCVDAEIFAFEPHPVTSRVLALNAWLSGADITPYALALSGGERLLALTTAATNLGDTRSRQASSATMLSPAAPLDVILPRAQFDLVKIDVQGYEPEVIAGMSAMTARSPGVVIVAEFWPTALRERGLDPVEVLRSYTASGFVVRVQVSGDLARMSAVETVRTCDQAGSAGQVNLVLTRKA